MDRIELTKHQYIQIIWMSVLVLVTDFVSHSIEFDLYNVTVIWPSGAVMLWLAIRYGPLAIIPIFVGETLFHHIFHETYIWAYLVIAAVNAAAAAAGAWAYFRAGGKASTINHMPSVVAFVFIAVMVQSFTSATFGTMALTFNHNLAWETVQIMFTRWLFSDITGAILCCPTLMTLGERKTWASDRETGFTAIVTVATLLCLWLLITSPLTNNLGQLPTVLLTLPVGIWLSLRKNTTVAFTSVMVVILSCLVMSLIVFDNFSDLDVISLQIYGSLIMVTALFLHVMMHSRDTAISALALQKSRLETMVKERTHELELQIEQTRKLADKLEHQANTDFLTKLPNRRAFIQEAQLRLERQKKFRRPTTLLLIDVDHFKKINDTHGHTVGDECLVAISNALKSQMRDDLDYLARLGGEEFVCLLSNTDHILAEKISECMRRTVEALQISTTNASISTTISIGVVVQESQEYSLEHLLQMADQRMYGAKDKGRNCIDMKCV